jgi:hypothetical protein
MINEELKIKPKTQNEWDSVVQCLLNNGNFWVSGDKKLNSDYFLSKDNTINICNDGSFWRDDSDGISADQFLVKYGHKFKVGDRVKDSKNRYGTIMEINNFIEVKFDVPRFGSGTYDKFYGGNYWCSNENELELVEESKELKTLTELMRDGLMKTWVLYTGETINKYETEYPRDGNVGGVKKVMQNVKSFVKRLTLSSDDKLLREYGFQNECGDYTDEARELVISKLVADNKAYIVEIAQRMKEEDEKK